MSLLKILAMRGFIHRWIGANSNLLLLQKRLRQEIPARRRRGFYRTWVLAHISARRREFAGDDSLSPLTVKVSPTLRCNLKCRGCFAANFPVHGDLPSAAIMRFVEQSARLGIRSVGVIGGEPLLVPGLFEIFEKFPRTGFYLVTNGTLVNEEIVSRLQALPNVITIFSVEGFQKTNDFLRGEGVFEKILEGMRRLREGKVIFGFSTVVHRENVREVVSERYLDFMIAQGCFFGGFLPYVPVGSEPRYDVVCGADEVREYYRLLDTIGRTRPLLILKEGTSDGTFLNTGCGAGHTIHITSSGEAEPCNGIEFATHNLSQSDPEEIFESGFFRDIRRLHWGKDRHCLVINRPDDVLQIVERHGARPTHAQALEHLEVYAELRRGKERPTFNRPTERERTPTSNL